MSDQYQPAIPATDYPSWIALLSGPVRLIMGGGAALGLYDPNIVSEPTVTAAVSVILGVVALVWTLWDKFAAKRALHAAAVISARMARPMMPRNRGGSA
jgi:hypothetical protein